MREESLKTLVHLPPDVLWDYLSDYDRVVRLGWDDSSARRIADSASCAARFKAHAVWEGVLTTYVACLEDARRPTTLVWSTKSGGSRSSVRFDLRAIDASSTQVTVTLCLRHGAALRALEPFAWGLLVPALHKTVSRLQHLDLEARDRS